MELLQLATALLKGGEELIPESVAAISRRAATIATVAAELLPQLKTSRIREVLEHHGISCTGCSSKMDYLLRLVPLLRLPVKVTSSTGSSKSSSSSSIQQQQTLIEPFKDPFNSHATALLKKPQEHVAQYMQRVFFRLLTLVPADYLAELEVACRRHDSKGRCISYLPQWVTAQAITIDKRTGMAHVSGPGAYTRDGDSSDAASLGKAGSDSSTGSCGSSGPTVTGPQLSSEPLFVPGDAAAGDTHGSPAAEPHNRAGVELCGFLHIRAIPPGVNLPTTGGSLTPQQQKALKDKAADSMAAGTAINSPFKGVYYYFYADVPAVVDRIINTFDPEEADFLFEQLDGLTAAKSLGLAGRLNTPQQKSCNEQTLLEGKAPATCSILISNIGSCARAPLKPPRRRIPLDPVPSDLGLPPTIGTYTPRFRSKVPPTAGWNGRGLGDSSSGDQDSSVGSSDGGLGSSSDRGIGAGSRGRHRAHNHHHNFPITDRELSDRQLQEQMAKLARDAGRRDRDDPLVPLTLACCAVASFGLYMASKRRRRSGFSSSSGSGSSAAARLVLLGLGTGRLKSGSGGSMATPTSFCSSGASATAPAAAAAVANGVGPPDDAEDWENGGPAAICNTAKQKRQVVAALRVAMNNTADAGKLEAALAEAEAADLDEAGLLQRARLLLDKRRKKDQARAAAEKARLRAQKKDEARKGRKAAAKQAAAVAVGQTVGCLADRSSSTSSRISDAASHAEPGAVEGSDAGMQQGLNHRSCDDAEECRSDPVGGGMLLRLLQFFGWSAAAGGNVAEAAADNEAVCTPSWDTSRASSASLSRVSSTGAVAVTSDAATAAGASPPAAPGSDQGTRKQQRQCRHEQRRDSNSSGEVSSGSSRPDVAVIANGARCCNSHPIHIGPTGSSVDEVTSMVDLPMSPRSPLTAAASVVSTASSKPNSVSSGKRGKGRDRGGNQQNSKITGFQEVEEVPGWTKASKDGSATKPLVVRAVLDPFTAAAAKAASHPLLSTPIKSKNKGRQAAAVHAAAGGPTADGYSPAKKLEHQQQRAAGSSGVTPPLTPPGTALGTPAAATARSNGVVKQAGPTGQYIPQQQHGVVPAGWIRRSAVSDDGSSSRPSTAGSLQQQGSTTAASTPSKPRLNPKATPYHPLASAARAAAAAAAAAGHNAAARYGSYMAAGPDWQLQQQGAGAAGQGYQLPMRGVSPTAGLSPGLICADGQQYQHLGLMLAGSHAANEFSYHGGSGHQGMMPLSPSSLGHTDGTAVDGGVQENHLNPLLSYHSTDQPGRYSFDQGLTSPVQHNGRVGLPNLAGMVAPQQQQFDRAGMIYQQMQHQQQLLELLSAAVPGEAAAAAAFGATLVSAGGSAPLHAGHGNSMMPIMAAAAAAAHAQRSSYSGVPEYHSLHAGGAVPPQYAAVLGVPPGFEGLQNAHAAAAVPPPAGLYGQGSGSSGLPGRKTSGVLPLSLDDDQLPPGFSAEDYSTPSSEHANNHATSNGSNYTQRPASTLGLEAPTLPATSPNNIPTTAPLGVFAAGSSVWGPLAATAGNAASTVAAGVRSLWPSTLATTTALSSDYSSAQHSYSRSQDLEVEVAAAATSANAAELVLGSSPSLNSGHVGAGGTDPQMSKLAKEIMAIVAE